MAGQEGAVSENRPPPKSNRCACPAGGCAWGWSPATELPSQLRALRVGRKGAPGPQLCRKEAVGWNRRGPGPPLSLTAL